MQQHWEFYIVDKAGIERTLATRACKKPSRTDLWKDMQRWLSENPFADFDLEQVGYRMTDVTKTILIQHLANALTTWCNCGGHHKAEMNSRRVKQYRSELAELKIDPPSDKELYKIGIFNGDGAY